MDEQTVVVGGGLAGLAAATLLARGGRSVALVEARADVGGRAVSTDHDGYRMNLGPHAVFPDGQGMPVLRQLGVRVTGSGPNPLQAALLLDGELLAPTGVARRLGWRGSRQVATALAALAGPDARADDTTSVQAWLAERVDHELATALVQALVRLAAYADAPDRLPVSVAADRQRAGLRGVRYADGGWQNLVDSLRAAAVAAGVGVVAGAPAAAVLHDHRVRAVALADGTTIPARGVVLAPGAPRRAARLLADGPAGERAAGWAAAAEPVPTACLDVALRGLPRPEQVFVLGLDTPLYLSVHSRWARLAPEGGAVVHVARPATGDPVSDRVELEAALDLVQPGWRDLVVHRRFLPDLAAVSWLASTDRGGLAGRPPVAVEGVEGLALAGDWVGPEGWLADASLASAGAAAAVLLASSRPGAVAAAGAGR